MSLFPDSILRKYQNDSVPPDILKIFNITPAELETPQGIFKYSEAFHLLSNHLNPSTSPSIISENFTIYKDIQQRFNLFYQKTSSDLSIVDQLLKAEQSIHLLSNEHHTLQDASTYFTILPKFCIDGSKLCQMILLLSKKHTIWNEEQSVTHHHWMNFMLPFFRFLKKFNFDDFSEKLSHSLEIYMTEIIQTLDAKEETIEQQLQEEVQNQKKKKSYYYKLGLLSLLSYMKRFISDQDLTLFKISIIAQCYLDEIKSSSSNVQGKALLAMYELDKILIRDNSIINMVAYIVSALVKAENPKIIELFSLLDYAFFKLHHEAQSKQSIFFEKPHSLLTSLFDVIQNHKQQLQSLPSPKYSLFSNYYNYFVWAFLRLVKILKYNLSSQGNNHTTLLSFYQEKILPTFSKEPLDLFIKGQFYQNFKESFCSYLTTTFTNLKDTFLVFSIDFNNLINDEDHDHGALYQLFLKFRMASSFIRNNSNKKELIDFSTSQEIQDLQNNFLSLIENPSQKDIKPKHYVGIFLLNLLRLATDQGAFMSFTKSFLEFLIRTQNMMTAWDLNFLRETLWPLAEKTELSFEDCFCEWLNFIKESISEFRYPSINLNDELLKKIKENVEAKEKFYKIVIESSFIEIQENLAKIWSLEPTNPFNDPETLSILQKQTNIFVCYLLPCVSRFAKILTPETVPDDKEKLQIISDKLIVLLSHPMFTYTGEDMNLLKEYKNIYQSAPFTQFLNPLIVIQSLQTQIDRANQALVSGLLQKKDLAQLKICTFQEEQRLYNSNQIPKIIIKDSHQDCQNNLMILIQSLSLNFLRFNKILSYSQSFKGIQSDQPIILVNLDTFLKNLDEFLWNLMDLFDDDPDIENKAENFFTNCFEFLANSIKYFSSTSDDITKLFVRFYRNLFQKAKDKNWDFSSRFYGMIFQSVLVLSFNEAPTKKVFTLIFFEYQTWADHIETITNFKDFKNLTQSKGFFSRFYKKLHREIFSNSVLRDYPQEFVKTTLFGAISYVKQKLVDLPVSEITPENSDMIHILLTL